MTRNTVDADLHFLHLAARGSAPLTAALRSIEVALRDLNHIWVDTDYDGFTGAATIHVARYDVANPGPDDVPRYVGVLDDDWTLGDAIRIAFADNGDPCACEWCVEQFGEAK